MRINVVGEAQLVEWDNSSPVKMWRRMDGWMKWEWERKKWGSRRTRKGGREEWLQSQWALTTFCQSVCSQCCFLSHRNLMAFPLSSFQTSATTLYPSLLSRLFNLCRCAIFSPVLFFSISSHFPLPSHILPWSLCATFPCYLPSCFFSSYVLPLLARGTAD